MINSPAALLTFSFVWLSFGVVAASAYRRRNYTSNKWKRELITIALVIGGIISLTLPGRYLRHSRGDTNRRQVRRI